MRKRSPNLFDVKSYLEYNNIEYWESGKNVTEGWTNIQCIFPFCDDSSNHLGISPDLNFNCWKCGSHGKIVDLIMILEDCNYHKAVSIMSEFTTSDEPFSPGKKTVTSEYIIMPKEIGELKDIHIDYLKKRNFDTEKLIQKYDLRACYMLGDFKYRIITPVIMNGEIVNYVGMDVTGKSDKKYKNCSNENCVMPTKSCLYNIDTVSDIAIIVEGITDVWRIGDSVVATLGVEFTDEQIRLLVLRNVKKVAILYDAEETAQIKAHHLATKLSLFTPIVEIFELEKGDPAEMSEDEVKQFRMQVGL